MKRSIRRVPLINGGPRQLARPPKVTRSHVFSQAGFMEVRRVEKTKPIPFQSEPIGGEITLEVCQGLGDIFWVYQKFAPYFDVINFEICVIEENDIQKRSIDWMRLFDKVNNFKTKKVNHEHYAKLSQSYSTMVNAIAQWKASGRAQYSCNKWLESGVRLDEIDPGSLIEWGVPMKSRHYELPFDKYILLYVSGSTGNTSLHTDPNLLLWNTEKWVDFMRQLRQTALGELPLVLPGAVFDKAFLEHLNGKLMEAGFTTHLMLQREPEEVVDVIKRAAFFVSYQSGLSIVGDNFDKDQMMIYFPCYKDLHYTWCKPGNKKTKFFAYGFEESPAQVIADRAAYGFNVA